MGTYTTASALKEAIRKKVQQAMKKVSDKGLKEAQENNRWFYKSPLPQRYMRTGQLGNSPETTGIKSKGSQCGTEIYLNTDFNYETGTWSTGEVFKAAEQGDANILGNSGFWTKTEENMPDIIKEAFTSEGFKK
jgi:hypothetical protein